MIFNFWPFRLALGIFCIYIFVLISDELNLLDSPIWLLAAFGIPLIALYFINTYKYNENAPEQLDQFTPNPIRIKKRKNRK